MKRLLGTFKKSEIAIYAIAIMLVAAGYLNYTTMNNTNDTVETSLEQYANIGDATLVNSDGITEENTTNNNEPKKEEVAKEENTETKNEVSNEAVETNNNAESDYFTNSKLERDTTYASMISNYNAILQKDNISDAEKKVAMNEIKNINDTKNAIMICENILSTKGLDKSVIFINDKSVNVVVQVQDSLNKEKVAQIQNIVSRELKVEISDIHITEKK